MAATRWRHEIYHGKLQLAVLPFQNLTGDSSQEYFSDGFTEEMITQMGSLDPQHLAVIARTSSCTTRALNIAATDCTRPWSSVRSGGERSA